MKELIEFTEFLEIEKKLEIRIGRVTSMVDVPKSTKLVKLEVDFGDEKRTVVTNIKPMLKYPRTDLTGLSFPFITNLKPVTMMGIISTAMILPGDVENGGFIYVVGKNGERVL